jgi:GNAT superfamily N-acetyltransferase
MSEPQVPTLESVLGEERALVLAFGGYAMEIPGGTLVVNERIPVPRFNFVQDISLSKERMSGFFERMLDHYFQRAIRPEVRIAEPVPAHLRSVLERYGFRPRPDHRSVLLGRRKARRTRPDPRFEVRAARMEELDLVVDFWASTREREELRRSLEVLWNQPHPGELVIPLLAFADRRPVAGALLHAYRGTWGMHAVATQPSSRGQGAASAMVSATLDKLLPESAEALAMWSDEPRVERRLELLGLEAIGRYRVYELAAEAQMQLPPLPPSPGPLWRPSGPARARSGRS